MAKVVVNASLNTKMKFFSDFENINPHCSITIERDVDNEWSDEKILEYGDQLYDKIRKVVEAKIESDIKSAKRKKFDDPGNLV